MPNETLTIVAGKPRKAYKPSKRLFKRSSSPKRTKRRKGEITLLKKKLWAVTRLLVFKTYGSDCYTCGKKNLTGFDRQGGHMPWASSELSVTCRYDIRYIRAQCYDCNINKNGRGVVALWKMQSEGIDTDFLWRHNINTKGLVQKKEFFIDTINKYKSLL